MELTLTQTRWMKGIRFFEHPKARETLRRILQLLADKYEKDTPEIESGSKRDTARWLRLQYVHDAIEWDDYEGFKDCKEHTLLAGCDALVLCGLAITGYFIGNFTFRITSEGLEILKSKLPIKLPDYIDMQEYEKMRNAYYTGAHKCRNIPRITLGDLACCDNSDWIITSVNGFWIDIRCNNCFKRIEGNLPYMDVEVVDLVIKNTNEKKRTARERVRNE